MDSIETLAANGDPTAQFALGLMHLNGHGRQVIRAGVQSIEKSENEAKKWFLASAEGGCVWAMYDYACLCPYGEERELWTHRAANCGLADAQVALSYFYCDVSHGVKPLNVVEAYKWALLAASQNHPCVVETNWFGILEHRMTQQQIVEAKGRADHFSPDE
jgi:TPR repeat protein